MFKAVRGMRDFLPERKRIKQYIEDLCREQFERYGFQPLETPAVEEFGLLAKKGSGGEAIKDEIYYFKDKSDRELGLRFDLTVPLARVAATNPQLPMPFKRYQIEKVWRYDRPQAQRYREFTQADIDVIGVKGIEAEFECIAVTCKVFKKLGLNFSVRINSRKLLEEIALACNVEKKKVSECFRCIDKLEKTGEEAVCRELKQNGFDDKIVKVLKKNDLDAVKAMLKNKEAMEELEKLTALLKKEKLAEYVKIDMGLARGLEYYTGIVFEVKLEEKASQASVGGGGRYDNLIKLYGGRELPAAGISFGVDRIIDALEAKGFRAENKTKVFLVPVGISTEKAIEIAEKIRAGGVNCEMDLMQRGISKNLEYASKQGIKFAAIVGEKELKDGAITLKNLETGKQENIKLNELGRLAGK